MDADDRSSRSHEAARAREQSLHARVLENMSRWYKTGRRDARSVAEQVAWT